MIYLMVQTSTQKSNKNYNAENPWTKITTISLIFVTFSCIFAQRKVKPGLTASLQKFYLETKNATKNLQISYSRGQYKPH